MEAGPKIAKAETIISNRSIPNEFPFCCGHRTKTPLGTLKTGRINLQPIKRKKQRFQDQESKRQTGEWCDEAGTAPSQVASIVAKQIPCECFNTQQQQQSKKKMKKISANSIQANALEWPTPKNWNQKSVFRNTFLV